MVAPSPVGGDLECEPPSYFAARDRARESDARREPIRRVNAFERALGRIVRVININNEVELRETRALTSRRRAARKSILLVGGTVEAGTNFNATPDFCSFTVDPRIYPEGNLEEQRRRLNAEICRDCG